MLVSKAAGWPFVGDISRNSELFHFLFLFFKAAGTIYKLQLMTKVEANSGKIRPKGKIIIYTAFSSKGESHQSAPNDSLVNQLCPSFIEGLQCN